MRLINNILAVAVLFGVSLHAFAGEVTTYRYTVTGKNGAKASVVQTVHYNDVGRIWINKYMIKSIGTNPIAGVRIHHLMKREELTDGKGEIRNVTLDKSGQSLRNRWQIITANVNGSFKQARSHKRLPRKLMDTIRFDFPLDPIMPTGTIQRWSPRWPRVKFIQFQIDIASKHATTNKSLFEIIPLRKPAAKKAGGGAGGGASPAQDGVRAVKTLDARTSRGKLLMGGLNELADSDDTVLRVQSERGTDSLEPNVAEVVASFQVSDQEPSRMTILTESRIDQMSGLATLRLRNWATGEVDDVGQYVVEQAMTTNTVDLAEFEEYIRAEDGRIELSVKHVVMAVFTADGFESAFDQIVIDFHPPTPE